MMPAFVVDLPGGGGKRLASTFESYNEETGLSEWRAPGLPDPKGNRIYEYYDPYPLPTTVEELQKLREQQDLMFKYKSTREEDFVRKLEGDEEVGQNEQPAAAGTA